MNDGFQFLDIIFLAMLAGFIALRLRSVLGRRTGHERPPEEASRRYTGAPKDDSKAPEKDPVKDRDYGMDVEPDAKPVVMTQNTTDYRMVLSPSSPAFDGVEDIRRRDPGFSPSQFAAGARAAYDMILTGFWDGKTAEFRPYVSDEVFAQFEAAIRMRKTEGQTLRNKLDRVSRVEFADASLNGTVASISMLFVSDAILTTLDREDRIIAGDPSDPVEVNDQWTFERDLRGNDPNWILVATHSVMP
ncbi:Tim44/TimA family putative adaptor protein [Govanella unica]|uniref:Tim44/TimA family putative adaptor protein n=1 Tax=Govanella unica TaxID=2975056 RepID=A0A9X3TV63_9PROT|nr:Tim44/TimA family putative adaptor protein [Govania unica]MDA5192371.1 Tim44/TimA family putative adaptor protein [Govania unica]